MLIFRLYHNFLVLIPKNVFPPNNFFPGRMQMLPKQHGDHHETLKLPTVIPLRETGIKYTKHHKEYRNKTEAKI